MAKREKAIASIGEYHQTNFTARISPPDELHQMISRANSEWPTSRCECRPSDFARQISWRKFRAANLVGARYHRLCKPKLK
jgi:hypothetical protein